MEQIFVYSNNPVHSAEGHSPEIKGALESGCYIYELSSLADAKNFIFDALIQNIVENRLKIGRFSESGTDSGIISAFSQKLSAYLYITGNKDKIDKIVSSLLEERGVINIEGVVRFRLRELSDDISAFFDLLFYEYKVQKQYEDFITLVRDYIKIESTKEPVIHIVFRKTGFVLYNTQKVNVTRIAINKYKRDSYSSKGSGNDFLISSLLHFLPEKIIIHTGEKQIYAPNVNSRILETIKTIFEGRVMRCGGEECEFCGSVPGEAFSYCLDNKVSEQYEFLHTPPKGV